MQLLQTGQGRPPHWKTGATGAGQELTEELREEELRDDVLELLLELPELSSDEALVLEMEKLTAELSLALEGQHVQSLAREPLIICGGTGQDRTFIAGSYMLLHHPSGQSAGQYHWYELQL